MIRNLPLRITLLSPHLVPSNKGKNNFVSHGSFLRSCRFLHQSRRHGSCDKYSFLLIEMKFENLYPRMLLD